MTIVPENHDFNDQTAKEEIYHRKRAPRRCGPPAGRSGGRAGRPTDPEYESFLQELWEYRDLGCRITLGGKASSPEKVASACFREDSCYMRDFISDDNCRILGIDFIKIKEKEVRKGSGRIL